MSPEHDPNVEQTEKKTPLNKRLLQDFFLSYKLSQGNGQAQRDLFGALAEYYRRELPIEDHHALFNEGSVLTELASRAEQMKMPTHRPEDHEGDQEAKKDFQLRWEQFSDAIKSNYTVYEDKISRSIIRQDIKFQGVVRPSAAQGGDPHSSHFRDYVLNATPTGSEAFDAIFEGLRSHTEFGHTEEAQKLARAWESNHPGEQFFPEAPDQA